LAMLTIPFLDTGVALIRRKLTGRSIYSTDRGHLHHCLLRCGFSVPGVLRLVSLLCFLTVIGALASLALKNELIAICTALAVVTILVATRSFGYAEFLLLRGSLGRLVASFLRLRGEGQVRQSEVHLHGTACWKTLMDALTTRAFILNLQTVRIDISVPALHEEYHSQWQRFDDQLDEVLWRAELPLNVGARNVGRVFVSGYVDLEPLWTKVAELTRIIESFGRAVSPLPDALDQSLQRVLMPMWCDAPTEFVGQESVAVEATPAPEGAQVHGRHGSAGPAHRVLNTPLSNE
jgi:UDP-GlcNAc:undecaprenyl-phosphate GlcNAc-1-phosphate transferase